MRRGVSVLEQVKALGAPLPDPLHSAIQWRLLFPALGRALSLPAGLLFGLAPVGAGLVLWSAVARARQGGAGWLEAAAAAVAVGAGAWFFAATGWLGYYDSWVVLALVAVAFAPRREWVWLACLAAPWIDERFVLAVPLALLCRHLEGGPERRAAWKLEWGVPLALAAAFAAVRLFVLPGSAANATVGGYFAWLDFSRTPWTQFVWGAWEGWRFGWVLAGAALWAVQRKHGPAAAALLGATAGGVLLAGLLTAQDFSRSMLLLAPVVWLGLGAADDVPRPRRAAGLAALAGAALLLPAHQVMSESAVPVMTLNHELGALREPPPRLAPATYELKGVELMERGDPRPAEIALTLAIKLDTRPTSACKHRGLLYASAQRWPEALQDFRAWADNAPGDPDAWFLVAQAEAALGNAARARDELQRALGLAPKEWAARPDVTRFRARLGL
ncbi:tetratricopeptide repeat protein [Oleiharenicola sp. Vm1]|uniref:tetratricopeptide repeat protein n=1 Tax=Oleiharenicola sp. Vm1 TaxID=3398393 RepID=UPI0039F4CADC